MKPTTMGRFRYNFVFFMLIAARSSEKMRKISKDGEAVSLESLFGLVTSLIFTRFGRFSIVFPKTALFISLKKSFSKSLEACFLFPVLKSM